MQRSVKLKIIRPDNENITWEELGYLFRGLSFKVCRMSNFCMIRQLLHALKLETELLNPQGHLYCYPRLVEEFPEVPTGIICAAETRARKLFKRNAKAVLYSEASLPRFRNDVSIPIPVAGYKILRDANNNFYADIQILSRQGTKTQKLPGRIRLVLADNWRDKSAKIALRQISEGAVQRGVASLFREKKDWYFQIPYVTDAVNDVEVFEPGLVMGVTFGVHDALVYAFSTLLKRGAISGEEVLAHQKKFVERLKKIREQYNWSGRKGHGTKNALKPVIQLNEKEKNYRKLVNNRYAKWVVDIALKNRCGTIHLDAANYPDSEKKILLSRWPLYDLKEKIKQKAEEKGIQVAEHSIDTLRTHCSYCGKEQESDGERRGFVCKSCGYGKLEKNKRVGYISKDYNAARNLALYKLENAE